MRMADRPTTIPGADSARWKPSHNPWLIATAVMAATFMEILDTSVANVALPHIAGNLSATTEEATWVLTSYLVSNAIVLPMTGWLGMRFGRKRLLTVCIGLFTLASVLCGMAPSLGFLVVARILQGIGGGALVPISQAVLLESFPPEKRGVAMATFGMGVVVAPILGPTLGGWITDNFSWRWIFYVNLPIGAIALVVTSIVLRDRAARTRHKIDYSGSVLLLVGVSALLLVTTLGGSPQGYAWMSPQIIAMVAIGIGFVIAFLIREHYASEPIVPLRLFRKRVFSVSNAAGFIVGVAMFGAIIYLPVYLQVVRGVSPTTSGLMLLPIMAGLFTASIGSGQIIARIGRYKIFPIVGTALMTIGMGLFSTLTVHTSFLVTSAFMLLTGFGLGLVMQVLILAVQNGVDYKDLGTATSLAAFFRSMGGAFGTALLGAVLNDRLIGNLSKALPVAARPHVSEIAREIVGSPAQLKLLPSAIHTAATVAYVHTIDTVFLIATPVVALAFVLSLALPEIRLRKTVHTVAPEHGASSHTSESVEAIVSSGKPSPNFNQ